MKSEWTTKSPTEPGYYWCECGTNKKIYVAEVCLYGKRLHAVVARSGIWEPIPSPYYTRWYPVPIEQPMLPRESE